MYSASRVRKLFILTLGFEEKFAVRMITRHGLDEGDSLIAITGPRVEKVERTIVYLHEFISKYYSGDVHFSVREISPQDGFDEMVLEVVNILLDEGKKYDRVIVNLSGGMRVICLATFMASLLVAPLLSKKLQVELETEDSSAFVIIPSGLLNLPRSLSEIRLEETVFRILQLLMNKEYTAAELAKTIGKDVTTIRRHLAKLRESGLIVSNGARPAKYRLTSQGRLVVYLMQKNA